MKKNNQAKKIIDVRRPDEFEKGHAKGSINIPLQEMEKRLDEIKKIEGTATKLQQKSPAKPIAKTKPPKKEDPMVVVGAIIDEIRPFMTKKSEMMLFIKITDFTGTMDAVVFPRVFSESRSAFVLDQCLAIKGRVTERRGEKSIIIERVKKLE